MLPFLFLFFFFLLLSAFFSSSETAFLSANPYKLEILDNKGSVPARRVKRLIRRVDKLLATILVGNTLVNTAAASLSTYIFVSLMKDKNQAVFFATLATTFLILILSEITPKTYAAYNPVKLSLLLVQPLRFFVVLFYPLVVTFTFISQIFFPSKKKKGTSSLLNEEEIKILFGSGVKGMSSLRKRMISGVLDIGSRPVKEIMIPRLQVEALEISSGPEEILSMIRTAGFSRLPVYRSRIDNIEGLIHAKDVIASLAEGKDLDLRRIMRKPMFVPEFASLEKVLLQMQESTSPLAFVVDEFGNMEGIVTLEDILEEIVGEIRDEYDPAVEDLISTAGDQTFILKGHTPVKSVNQQLNLKIPEKGDYSTIAGFFLDGFGRIPKQGDYLIFKDLRLTIERMMKRHIQLIRVERVPEKETAR